jgi:hypothetical protein
MNINKGNIDEHLFEYFEEQLSPTQADALMDFIHQNPEFEKDFVQWKKAYHHKDHVTEDYGIAAKIKGSIRINRNFKSYYFGGILVLGLAMGWLVNSVSGLASAETNIAEVHEAQHNGTQAQKAENNSIAKEKVGALPKPKSNKHVQETEDIEGAVDDIKEESKTTSESNPIIATEESRDEGKGLNPQDDKLTVAEADSSVETHEIQAAPKGKSAPQNPKKKSKGKRKGIFSTSDKILPVNSNF